MAREGGLARTRWAKDDVKWLLLLLEEVVVGQETTCWRIKSYMPASILLTDVVHCSPLEVLQKLDSVLFLVLRWVTLDDPQWDIVYMRVFPCDGHLAVIAPDTLEVLLSQWVSGEPCLHEVHTEQQ